MWISIKNVYKDSEFTHSVLEIQDICHKDANNVKALGSSLCLELFITCCVVKVLGLTPEVDSRSYD